MFLWLDSNYEYLIYTISWYLSSYNASRSLHFTSMIIFLLVLVVLGIVRMIFYKEILDLIEKNK